MITYIQCENCGKTIEKKGKRRVCVKCANLRDREHAKQFREEHREEIRERVRNLREKRKAEQDSIEEIEWSLN